MEISSKSPQYGTKLNLETPTYRLIPSSLKETNINRTVEVFNLSKCPPLSGLKSHCSYTMTIYSSYSTPTASVIWVLRSSGRRVTVVNYLFHKWLFGTLNNNERLVFFDLPESSKNDMIYSALKARAIGHSMKTIRKALVYSAFLLFGKQPPTNLRWVGYRTYTLSIEREVRHVPERKVKKYSGWKRHQNDHGSLGPPKEDPFYSEPFDSFDNISSFLQICDEIKHSKSDVFINNIRVKL